MDIRFTLDNTVDFGDNLPCSHFTNSSNAARENSVDAHDGSFRNFRSHAAETQNSRNLRINNQQYKHFSFRAVHVKTLSFCCQWAHISLYKS